MTLYKHVYYNVKQNWNPVQIYWKKVKRIKFNSKSNKYKKYSKKPKLLEHSEKYNIVIKNGIKALKKGNPS